MNHYKIYINWKVKLLDFKDPQNIKEFCDKYNLTNTDILGFHETPSFEDDLRKASLSWLQTKIPELLHLAYKEAKESQSVQDIERLVDIAHRLKKKNDSDTNQFNFFNLDESKFRQIANRYGGEASILSEGSAR